MSIGRYDKVRRQRTFVSASADGSPGSLSLVLFLSFFCRLLFVSWSFLLFQACMISAMGCCFIR
ncbi:hypothetical protein HDV62DRAFT_374132 [Trichoderma sp. SZMC 28011]